MKKHKKDSFIQGILALIFSQLIIKAFGIIYSVYLTNKNGFGDSGNAIYMSGYQIYTLLLAISSIGIPNAISKLVSERIAIGDYRGADRIFKIALILFSIIGFFCTSMLFLKAEFIANNILEISESKYTLKALAPAIFFVSISSVIRGYCNGKRKISITAKSQTVEQFCKSLFTIIFVEIVSYISYNNTKLMAAVANLATTFATIFSFIYIFVKNQKYRKNDILNINRRYYEKEDAKKIVKKIFAVSIPMSISSLLSSVNKNIDSITVIKILKKIFDENTAKIKYGILSTKVDLIVAMPMAFNMAFSTALVPEIASSLIRNDLDNINQKLKFSIIITMLIGMPCTFGIFTYSKQILKLLFPNASNGAYSLKIASIMIIFSVLIQTINGALQGIGKNKIPAISLFGGMITKIITNIMLIPIKGIYENGAIIGNICCYIVSFLISYYYLKKNIHLNFKLSLLCIKPIIISFCMIIISYSIFIYLNNLGIYEYMCTIVGIISAIIAYIPLIFLFKILSKEDICLLPNGKKIYEILKKIKIY